MDWEISICRAIRIYSYKVVVYNFKVYRDRLQLKLSSVSKRNMNNVEYHSNVG